MEPEFVKSVLRENWYLVVLLALIVGFVGYKAMTSDGAATPSGGPPGDDATQLQRRDVLVRTSVVEEETEDLIREHEEALKADPRSKDAPARLNAMGNLYQRKLGNYQEAIRCYEWLLVDYPDWESAGSVYVKLAGCYRQIGDTQRARRVYEEMIEKFPADSEEHRFAEHQLSEGF